MNIIERIIYNYTNRKAWKNAVKEYDKYFNDQKNDNTSLGVSDHHDGTYSFFDNNKQEILTHSLKLSLKRKK